LASARRVVDRICRDFLRTPLRNRIPERSVHRVCPVIRLEIRLGEQWPAVVPIEEFETTEAAHTRIAELAAVWGTLYEYDRVSAEREKYRFDNAEHTVVLYMHEDRCPKLTPASMSGNDRCDLHAGHSEKHSQTRWYWPGRDAPRFSTYRWDDEATRRFLDRHSSRFD
jgi:hypothetical protein